MRPILAHEISGLHSLQRWRPGAEAAFGEAAEHLGIEEVNFTFDSHKMARARGVRLLNHEELQAGDVSLEYVSKLTQRRYTDARTIRKIPQTLWYQINSGQEVCVIGTVLPDGTVRGGTDWGTELAKLCNKPLHVFDQEKNCWDRWTGTEWTVCAAPARPSSRIRISPAQERESFARTANALSAICSSDGRAPRHGRRNRPHT